MDLDDDLLGQGLICSYRVLILPLSYFQGDLAVADEQQGRRCPRDGQEGQDRGGQAHFTALEILPLDLFLVCLALQNRLTPVMKLVHYVWNMLSPHFCIQLKMLHLHTLSQRLFSATASNFLN